MHSIPIRFSFDYVDPGSYLVDVLLRRWQERESVALSIEWSPLELRVPGTDPVRADDPTWSAMTDAMRIEADRHGIEFETPHRIPLTRKTHELALHAHEKGCFEALHRALFEAHFAEGRDIGRVDVLVRIGKSHGLEPSETRTVLGVDRFLPTLEKIRTDTLGRGVRGVPTIEAGRGRMEGFQTRDELEDLLERARSELASGEIQQNR